MKNVEAKVVREAAYGKWGMILPALAPTIPKQAFDRLGRHTPCPVHASGTGDGFKLFKKDFEECGGGMCNTCGKFSDGFKMLQWVNGWDFVTALMAVADYLGIANKHDEVKQRAANRLNEADVAAREKKRLADIEANDLRIRSKLQSIWKEAIPLTAPEAEPARLYLASRRILCWDRKGIESVVRFHRSLASYDEDLKYEGHFPAIVAVVTDANQAPCTIHRIFLTPKGEKAPVQSCKKMCEIPSTKKVMGGGIITSQATEVIDVCEGLETAWAIEQAMAIPVWPLVNATLLEGFVPPAGVKSVRIWVDVDRSGRGVEAGKILKRRLWDMGLKATLVVPSLSIPDGEKGVDWNDVLVSLGRFGFPSAVRKTEAA